METQEQIILHVNETHQMILQSRGATGLQLLYKCDDDSIVQVKRLELNSDSVKLSRENIGGPVPAVFEIRALKIGETKITFYETRPWDKNFKEIIQQIVSIKVI